MKSSLRFLGRIASAAIVWLVVLLLPVVPVLKAPVVPNPVYEPTMVSVLALLGSYFLMGIRLKATWLTLPVVIALIFVASVIVRYCNRRMVRGTA